jgi:hypothetical protein
MNTVHIMRVGSRFQFRSDPLYSCQRIFVVWFTRVWAVSAQPQSVTWQILPWPDDANWLGPHGSPALTNRNQITLTGQVVLSAESFFGYANNYLRPLYWALTTVDGTFRFEIVRS